MLPVKLGVSNVNCFIKSSYLPCNSLYQVSKRPSISISSWIPHELFVQLLSLGQALLLGSLLRNLAVVVRCCRSRGGHMWGNLGLDGLDKASAFLLALVDGLGEDVQLATGFPWAEDEAGELCLGSLPEW